MPDYKYAFKKMNNWKIKKIKKYNNLILFYSTCYWNYICATMQNAMTWLAASVLCTQNPFGKKSEEKKEDHSAFYIFQPKDLGRSR